MTPGQTAKNVLAAACVLGLLYVAWLLREVLLLAVLASFVAVALSGPVNLLHARLPIPRALAILLVYLLLAGVLVLIGLLVLPPLIDEFNQFLRGVPRLVRELEDSDLIARWDREYGIVSRLESEAGKLPSLAATAFSELELITVGALERIVEFVAILAVAFLLLLDAPRLLDFVFREVVPEREAQARRLISATGGAVAGYVAGVFAVALLAGFVSFIVMSLLGIPFAVPLAVQMAFFAILPLVGSTIGATVIGLVALTQGWEVLLIWGVFWVAYQQTETHVLGPFVYRRAVDLSPVLVILSVLAGATLLGVLGALLAIPAAATIQILLREWWRARPARRSAPTPAPRAG